MALWEKLKVQKQEEAWKPELVSSAKNFFYIKPCCESYTDTFFLYSTQTFMFVYAVRLQCAHNSRSLLLSFYKTRVEPRDKYLMCFIQEHFAD